jgi:hypothetical protein
LLSAAEVSAQLNKPEAEVDAARVAGTLLAVEWDGHWTFPRAQFHDNGLIDGLAAFMRAHKGSSPWVTLDAFTAPDTVLNGLSPRDALVAGGAVLDQLHVLLRAEAQDQDP